MNLQPESVIAPPPLVKTECRVLIVEDHPLTRRGLVSLIADAPSFKVCGEAASFEQGLALTETLNPDVVTVDVSLREQCGIDLTARLIELHPSLKVLVLSMHEEDVYAERSLAAGARGYITKREASEKVVEVLRTVADGGVHVEPRLRERLLAGMARGGRESTGLLISKLSGREVEVFRLIGEGYTTGSIALKLGLSVKTIDSYRDHLKTKLGLPSGAELVHYAVTWLRSEWVGSVVPFEENAPVASATKPQPTSQTADGHNERRW